ncbi:MAG: metallophosphoesterase [Planctomycetota bacterium]
MKFIVTIGLLFFYLVHPAFSLPASSHDGPDPWMSWRFDRSSIGTTDKIERVKARLGPPGKPLGDVRFIDNDEGGSLFLTGAKSGIQIVPDFRSLKNSPPRDAITVSFTGSVDKPQQWGGLAGIIQDNGSDEHGWILGYNQDVFTFAVRSKDGPGRLTYLEGRTRYEAGKIYHVVGIYDGNRMQIYVNGKLESESMEQSGPIDYPRNAPFTLGAYHDANEFYGHRGRFHELAIYSAAAKPEWVEKEFQHYKSYANQAAAPIYEPLAFEINPYLQFGTLNSMTVMWKTNRTATTKVFWGKTNECKNELKTDQNGIVHECTINQLEPQTHYFYRVESQSQQGKPSVITSSVSTFQTAVKTETPFAFAVISDTQGNPEVSGKLAAHAWGQRPNFLLHPGDLVSTGGNDSHWTDHFFPSMDSLIQRVPFYPVLGNHEQNAKNYFDYVSLPEPEYFYTFQFGNTQFFMIDSNRNVAPESEQYQWLEQQLTKSDAIWKFVCHHHPPYSSDENDYGNLWKTNVSTRGDQRVRQLIPLYEKHNVDFVWNGHIHSYERTWPIREGRSVESDAPIYMITGGGGGSLETPGPVRPFFQNTVRYGHHYSMVRINGRRIEIQVYDLENRLFDQLSLVKK